MPPIYTKTAIRLGIHEFKTHIAHYIRELNKGEYTQIILTSRGKPIGGFYTFEGVRAREQREKMKELLSGSDVSLSGLLGGSD